MSTFVISENIRRFKVLLAAELEPRRRRTIEGLLAAEEAKLAALGPQYGSDAFGPPSG
jgi:hypothetical protein